MIFTGNCCKPKVERWRLLQPATFHLPDKICGNHSGHRHLNPANRHQPQPANHSARGDDTAKGDDMAS